MVIALFDRNSLASLLDEAILLFTIIFIIVSSFDSIEGIPLNTISISLSVNSFTFPVNNASDTLMACSASSLLCMSFTTS